VHCAEDLGVRRQRRPSDRKKARFCRCHGFNPAPLSVNRAKIMARRFLAFVSKSCRPYDWTVTNGATRSCASEVADG
jgi:hypothetical protein